LGALKSSLSASLAGFAAMFARN